MNEAVKAPRAGRSFSQWADDAAHNLFMAALAALLLMSAVQYWFDQDLSFMESLVTVVAVKLIIEPFRG